MVIVEQLDNVLAVNNELQHCLEWITNRICCLYVTSLLSLCCSKDVLDKQMNTMRTASLEVARWEHVMQQYRSLLIGGCVVSNHTSKLSGFTLSDDMGNVLSNILVIMLL